MPLTDGDTEAAAAVAAESAAEAEESEDGAEDAANAGLLSGRVAARDNLVGIAGVGGLADSLVGAGLNGDVGGRDGSGNDGHGDDGRADGGGLHFGWVVLVFLKKKGCEGLNRLLCWMR